MIFRKTFNQQKRLVIILTSLFVIITMSCGKITTADEGLIGIWKASDTRYDNSSFGIKRKSITFTTKEGDVNSFKIIEVKKELMQDKEWVQYTIFYLGRNLQKVEFPFYFRQAGRGVIRFKNQLSLVWEKMPIHR